MTLGDDLVAFIDRRIRDALGRSRTTTYGVVTATSPLTVRISGDTTGTPIARALTAYTPTVGDEVALLRVGADWICLGDYV